MYLTEKQKWQLVTTCEVDNAKIIWISFDGREGSRDGNLVIVYRTDDDFYRDVYDPDGETVMTGTVWPYSDDSLATH
jgi:hypothetical protein